MRLLHVVGARPNFPKLAPVFREAQRRGVEQVVVHTGQHYDDSLSGSFFRDLGIPPPAFNLDVGSATHAVQTARVMERIEPVLVEQAPDWVLVYGDVNSTVAAALVAAKLQIRVAHVEAGLRSFDWTMPEEINRVVTDRLSQMLLTPSRDADIQLLREGCSPSSIHFVGNVMIDSLHFVRERGVERDVAETLEVAGRPFAIVTLHRPSNVDDPGRLRRIVAALNELAERMPVLLFSHPRTSQALAHEHHATKFQRRPPLRYPDMVNLMASADIVITDSGGLQEETTALGVRCLTLRPNTERPITITDGTNRLVPEPEGLLEQVVHHRPVGRKPEGWDGAAAHRVLGALIGAA
jgi:UDP-N-acetylglucosamine 2-epimerase (non-hydrolysing)